MVDASDLAIPGTGSEPFDGPVALVSRGLPLPTTPGVYAITCGDCIAHIGTSRSLRARVATLARLGTHRGSSEVLCAASCTGQEPLVWWRGCPDEASARILESALKRHHGEPPVPRERYADCVNGRRLMERLIQAAGPDSWEAGYVQAAFTIGEKLSLLFAPRMLPLWEHVGCPPGPWAAWVSGKDQG